MRTSLIFFNMITFLAKGEAKGFLPLFWPAAIDLGHSESKRKERIWKQEKGDSVFSRIWCTVAYYAKWAELNLGEEANLHFGASVATLEFQSVSRGRRFKFQLSWLVVERREKEQCHHYFANLFILFF